ncbi:MAG: bifunctional riboflavin kinase/FAD synthetase [Pseudolabrys sp.]
MTSSRQPFHIVRGDSAALDPGALAGCVVAIGNFDGVHRGHRAVIAAALARARALGRPAAALTFDPHPRTFFWPDLPVFRLSTERDKMRLLAATGLDGAVILRFDRGLAATTAQDFIGRILVGRLGVAGAAIGFDFHFGKDRQGSPAYLAGQGAEHGFAVDVVPPLQDEGRPVSSGAVREALAAGKVVEAAELIGAPWFVSGEVIHGEKRGRDLGFPTANVRLDASCGLKHGIYAVRASVDGRLIDGVASFGRRPTFDNGAPLLETFLFDFSGDLYGKTIDVAFIGWIRGEEKFASIDALKRAMDGDAARARDTLARAPGAFPALGAI